jgi:hypothetical protein
MLAGNWYLFRIVFFEPVSNEVQKLITLFVVIRKHYLIDNLPIAQEYQMNDISRAIPDSNLVHAEPTLSASIQQTPQSQYSIVKDYQRTSTSYQTRRDLSTFIFA